MIYTEKSDDIIKRLAQLGYTYTDNDKALLVFVFGKVCADIMHYCNLDDVPKELSYAVIDRVCGEFLENKKQTGQLTGYDFSAAVSSITEGDTTVSFSGATSPEQRFDMLVGSLKNAGGDLSCYRKMQW